MDVIQRIWKDSVLSNAIGSVIGGLILLAISAIWAALSGLSWSHPVSIPLWLVVVWGVLSAVAALFIVRSATTKRPSSTPSSRPTSAAPLAPVSRVEPKVEKKIVIERLSEHFKLRYDFVARIGEVPRTGQAVWQEKYLEAYRLLGPVLMAGAAESTVKDYLDQAIKDGSAGRLSVVHVVMADFHSMKIRLVDIGVITLTPKGGQPWWELTSEASRLLPQLH
ncbi:hypothetical protein AB4Y40_11125 [Paraburkholderia sp. EG287B]|uniref:hypothetical protein n=1 Tax=Paraburkholderia sp. EG287B TaxID=3237010 RepID=UPI0034D31A20